jgi:hypothetical protein
MTAHDSQQLATGLADLSRFERGTAAWRVGADGELVYDGTVATVKMHKDEGFQAFIARLRAEGLLRAGDVLELLNNGAGHCDTARISRKA